MKPSRALPALLVLAAATAGAQSRGQAEVAVQGYYLRTGPRLTSGTTGAVVKFEEFLPNLGLLRGNFEAYRSEGGIQPADNYLQLRGVVWHGLRWNFGGGDFRRSGTLLRNPFTNLFIPEINARGVDVEAGDSKHGYAAYYGTATLLAGPRIPFRISVPQTITGASAWQKFGRLHTGVRVLHFENGTPDPNQQVLFPAGRDFRSADNITAYSTYTFNDHFQWYAEATAARAESTGDVPAADPISYFFGPAWESPRFTARANYAMLTRSYFPVAGYWTGDRKGPFGEVRVRPFQRVEFFGSASRYESASKPSDGLPLLRSDALPVGVSVTLPWKLNASAQLSTGTFSSFDPATDARQRSDNRQWTGSLSRQIARHSLRFTGRDMRLLLNGVRSRERAGEVEDTFHIGRLVSGVAVRLQSAQATDRRNSVYVRASAQYNVGRVTALGFYERGKDLANQTVFATAATNSTVISANVRVTREWSVQGEAFRTRLISEINPENLFVLGNQSLALHPLLSQFQQWSFLFRIGRTFRWGGAKPGMGLDQYTEQRIPITGSVEGFVHLLTDGGRQPAPDVTLRLETGQSVVTDAQGRYRFADVPEGGHAVSIDVEQLPADYNPGPKTSAAAIVGARKIARADFELYGLAGFSGRVHVSDGAVFETLEGILVRLEPSGAYTMTLKDGTFAFHNLPDGTYTAVLDPQTLPTGARLKGDASVAVAVRTGSETPTIQFSIERRVSEVKPVRKVLETTIPVATR